MICSTPHVTIVLATHNGARFISAQLHSLSMQTHSNWHVILTDDGSDDATVQLARQSLPESCLTIVEGPGQGVAANFLSGLRNVKDTDYVAFCDQDDVWHRDKLERAISRLAACDGPAFVSTARVIADCRLRPLRIQRRRTVGFRSLMFRNCAAGNTFVMNAKALNILRACWPTVTPAFHDWWSALVLTGTGATWINDPLPSLLYRQHGANLLGAGGGRVRSVINGTRTRWIAQNLHALQTALPRMADPQRSQYTRVYGALTRVGLPGAPVSAKTVRNIQTGINSHVGRLRKIAGDTRPFP